MSTDRPLVEKMLQTASLPKWLQEMHEHYAKAGSFRTEDILRVLGDPRKGVDMTSEEKAKAFFGISPD
jgi:hypothetical protein